MTPLRGLEAFVEGEREVFFGREEELEALADLVNEPSFRAGLLHGEPGAGKTSLLRAGLIPHLRDHGVIALFCDDIFNPIESFAAAVTAHTGLNPNQGEKSIAFLARVVGQALPGQLYVFVLDEVDVVLESGDERVVGELGDLFARVVTRSGGRARFLFSCASERMHLFGTLEMRTGSLFPPTCRFHLERFPVEHAIAVLERTLSFALVAADPALAHAVAQELGRHRPLLPADIQISAVALRELGITSVAGLEAAGGAGELEAAWLSATAAATGNEKSALRLIAELASNPRPLAYAPDWAATRCSVDPGFARHAFTTFQEKGLVKPIAAPSGNGDTHYMLAHEILVQRVREHAAPARASARRAFELLGSKAAEQKRLSLREWMEVRREGLQPATGEERAVLQRTKRFFSIIAGAIVATPILILIIIYVSMSGSFYLDTAAPGGGPERIVVRTGNPGLSSFDWMGFGSIVADTGLTEEMVSEKQWSRARNNEASGDLGGNAYVEASFGTLDPVLLGLIEYASSGSDEILEELRASAEDPESVSALLARLVPVARGSAAEVGIVESALGDPSPAVQSAALAVAASAAERHPDAYHDTLAKALTAPDADLRRSAFSAVRALGDDAARELFQAALATNPEPEAQRELLAVVTSADNTAATPSAGSATAVLANHDVSQALRERARNLLRRAFATEPVAAATAAAELAADGGAPEEDRILALEMLLEHAPEESYDAIRGDVKSVKSSKPETLRAAALPLWARVAPKLAGGDLAVLLDDPKTTRPMKVATALAWGEIARATKDSAAVAALEKLLKDDAPDVRAAAARAYGNTGWQSQRELTKMVKKERFDVAAGAAHGLANSAMVGANANGAAGGIYDLWKRKGRARRIAAEVYAKLARKHPRTVYGYIRAAAFDRKDESLHALGVRGLCNAVGAGHRGARRDLIRAAGDDAVSVRRIVIECAIEHPKETGMATSIAVRLADDVDSEIRAEAARVLASVANKAETAPDNVAKTLVALLEDPDRSVRLIAVRALAALGEAAPEAASKTLAATFEGAPEDEKLVMLETARAIGAGNLAELAITDASPLVRVAAVDTAIATGANVQTTLNAALTDTDRGVRRAALGRLAEHRDDLDQSAIDHALNLAIDDPDPGIADVAFRTFAILGAEESVTERLRRDLASRSERVRARAARAATGIVERNTDTAIELLEPLLDDPSHDVRAAMLPGLATAYAAKNSVDQLGEMLRGSEKHAMRRLTATTAFLMVARTDGGRDAAITQLRKTAEDGSPLVKVFAALGAGLIEGDTDGVRFLQTLVP